MPQNAQCILLGFYFEDFLAVGGVAAHDRVVGISKDTWAGGRPLQWQAYAAAVPRLATLGDVGEVDSGTFSLEAALALEPDPAILAAWQYDALGDAATRLEAAGVPIVVLDDNAQQVDRHVSSTLAPGAILGAEERATELADLYATSHADVVARVARADTSPRVYVELGRKGANEADNSYGNTMWGQLIAQAGGRNIAEGQIAKWGPLSPEYVLTQDPEVIILAGSGWTSRDQAVLMGPGVDAALTHARMQPYAGRAGWDGLTAVQAGAIHGLYHGGARTLYDFVFFQSIAKPLHPEQFGDVDPQANLTAFFKRYMPITFDGTYMTQMK